MRRNKSLKRSCEVTKKLDSSGRLSYYFRLPMKRLPPKSIAPKTHVAAKAGRTYVAAKAGKAYVATKAGKTHIVVACVAAHLRKPLKVVQIRPVNLLKEWNVTHCVVFARTEKSTRSDSIFPRGYKGHAGVFRSRVRSQVRGITLLRSFSGLPRPNHHINTPYVRAKNFSTVNVNTHTCPHIPTYNT